MEKQPVPLCAHASSMDKRTLKALEFGKILELLAAQCVSEAGRTACLALKPYETLAAVHAEQALFEQAGLWLAHCAAEGDGGFLLVDFPDCTGLFEHLASPSATLDADALFALRMVLSLARRAVLSIREGETRWPDLHALAHAQPLPELLIAALNRCLNDDGLVRDGASPELLLVRSEMRSLHQSCLRKVKDFAVQYNIAHYLQDEFMTLASDRYVLPLKANFKGRIQGIIHDYSNTGETCYFEPMFLVAHNNRLQELKREEREEERKVFAMLSGMVRADLPLVREAWSFMVRLDGLLARHRLGALYDGVMVTVTPTSGPDAAPLSLRGARHPLLVLDPQMRRQGGPQPVDLHLRPQDRALIVSGGNAGGKTVCLKTLGLLAAMSFTGLPVPAASGSAIPWWPSIHALIGDEQSLDDHVSTFTAQIASLASIWPTLGPGSLVLLDEFGAGTDPAQGAALAQALLDELVANGACTVAATHFPALKTYALTHEHVRAASVLFDPATKRPLFRLAYDQVGASLALDVAREHGLPETVLKRAEHYLLLDGQDMTAIMDRLNALAASREQELAALHEEERRTREKRAQYKERFERERERLHTEVRGMAGELMRAWKAGKITAKQALKDMSRLRASLVESVPAPRDETPAAPELDLTTLKQGQEVIHRPWGKKAVVQSVDLRQKRVKLDMNGVSLWVNPSLIEPAGQPGAKARPSAPRGVIVQTSGEQMPLLRLDLRGKRADLALTELERFLDRALLSGMDGVEIVHGRGTGVLRRQVHERLRTFPGVGHFTLAPEDQGGDGVTLVTFK